MRKRIKITEAQAKSLGLINENVDMVVQFEQFCKIKSQELNQIYSHVITINVENVIDKSVDLTKMIGRVENIEDKLRIAHRNVERVIIGQPNEDELDSRLDDAEWVVKKKINALQTILATLYHLRILSIEDDLTKPFSDNTPRDITSQQP